jgi:TetR/AcrR family transcriptional regulator, transcriptional repressor for nem operon
MPRPSLKEDIIAAALETLHTKGFNGTSVQDITDAAEVPKGSFYNHFESKEDLAADALDRYWQQGHASLSLLTDEKTPPLERLKRYFRRLGAVARQGEFRRGCFIGNLGTEMSEQSPLLREKLSTLLATWTRAIESCVKEAQASGSLRRDIDASTIASFLLNAWEGALMRSKVDRNARSFAAFEDVVFTALAA